MNDVKYDVNDMPKPGLLVMPGICFATCLAKEKSRFWLGLILPLLCSHSAGDGSLNRDQV